MMPTKSRVLMFDIWRIVAILMIVAIHASVASNLRFPILYQTYGFLGNISSTTGLGGNLGNIGVELFIILSGCVLEYNYGQRIRESAFNYWAFIEKRLVHLYPAYWLSLILALLVNPALVAIGVVELLKTASGFWIFQTLLSNVSVQQPINPMGWFIGLIVCLYLLFPLTSRFLAQRKAGGLFVVFAVSLAVRIALLKESPDGLGFYWFPLSRLFEFALGIYMVQNGLYFKTVTTSNLVRFVSDLCFPVFLVHYILIPVLSVVPTDYYLNVIMYVTVVLGFASVILMTGKYCEQIVYRSNRWSLS